MARRAKPKDADGSPVVNLTEAKEAVREAVTTIISLRSDRKEINAAIGEQRARCKNLGVPPAALDLAIRMKESDPEDRKKHDEGYLIARDALGLRLQLDMFEGGEGKAPAAALSKARQHLAGSPDALQ